MNSKDVLYRRMETSFNPLIILLKKTVKQIIVFSKSVHVLLMYCIARANCDYFSGKAKINAAPLFVSVKQGVELWRGLNEQRLYDDSELVLNHVFSFLGCSKMEFGQDIVWNKDYLSGFSWSNRFFVRMYPIDPLDDPIKAKINYDGKLPYELNRFQHLSILAQAYLLNADRKYPTETVAQIEIWLKNNCFLWGVNWTCAMEVAIRACNWMWAWWAFKDTPSWTREFNDRFLKSIWQHGWYIEHNLEDKGGIRTNHYLSDIVGLLFIGIMFPQFKDAERWKTFGVQELIRCMEEMVYPDGVSFENSTAYHRLVMELFIYSAILCKRNEIVLPEPFWQRLEKMYGFIMYCMRPDGRMPMIGDSDDGRFFILADYYDWDRWDFRYLLSIGAVLFERSDFKSKSGRVHEEVFWLFGEDGVEQYGKL
jgi:hypothetical protein